MPSQPNDLNTAFGEICHFCANYPSVKGGLPTGDPRAQNAVKNLNAFADWFRERFGEVNGSSIEVVVSTGAGAFPRVPWVCLLPPGQRVNDGVYVGMCFGKEGNGAVVGCMQSASKPKGLNTVKRVDHGQPPVIDVDGASAGTQYNNAYANPLEVFKSAFDAGQLRVHVTASLDIALESLKQLGADPEVKKLTNAFNESSPGYQSGDDSKLRAELGSPFDAIFTAVDEANWGFDLLSIVLKELGVDSSNAKNDRRICLSLSVRAGGMRFRLNFGNWAVLTFLNLSAGEQRLEYVCRIDLVPESSRWDADSAPKFSDLIDGHRYVIAACTVDQMRQPESVEFAAFKETLVDVAQRFANWQAGPYQSAHRPQLVRMVFDPRVREELLRKGMPDPINPEPDPEPAPQPRRTGVAYWWLNANPRIWDMEEMSIGQRQTYTSHNEKGNKRQKYRYFQEVKPGDVVLGYITSPHKEIVAVCKITKALHDTAKGESIEIEKIEQLTAPLSLELLQSNPDLVDAEPIRNNQGSLFKLRNEEFEIIRSLIDEENAPSPTRIEPYDKAQALKSLFLPESQLTEMLDALHEKKNVVLQGAPGVGKTFVARRLAYALIGAQDPQRVEMIQFHQSYSYEDFIQGYRPTPKGQFELRSGVFFQFCRRAQRDESRPYVFIIDEINRGNLSKIFGELMMLIEPDKRGRQHSIPLAYSQSPEDRFYLPENLHILGMMNTADRSLALVDYALRRRFRFITLRPEFGSSAFRNHLKSAKADDALIKKITDRMSKLNEIIAADTRNLGAGYQIGHSFFCPRPSITADDAWYRRVVESEIVPLMQEYWFDNDQKVEEQRAALLA